MDTGGGGRSRTVPVNPDIDLTADWLMSEFGERSSRIEVGGKLREKDSVGFSKLIERFNL